MGIPQEHHLFVCILDLLKEKYVFSHYSVSSIIYDGKVLFMAIFFNASYMGMLEYIQTISNHTKMAVSSRSSVEKFSKKCSEFLTYELTFSTDGWLSCTKYHSSFCMGKWKTHNNHSNIPPGFSLIDCSSQQLDPPNIMVYGRSLYRKHIVT